MADGIDEKVATACLAGDKTIAHAHAQRLLAAEKREEKKAKEAKKTGSHKATKEKEHESATNPKPKKKKKERKEPKTEYMKRKQSFLDKYLECNSLPSVPTHFSGEIKQLNLLVPRQARGTTRAEIEAKWKSSESYAKVLSALSDVEIKRRRY